MKESNFVSKPKDLMTPLCKEAKPARWRAQLKAKDRAGQWGGCSDDYPSAPCDRNVAYRRTTNNSGDRLEAPSWTISAPKPQPQHNNPESENSIHDRKQSTGTILLLESLCIVITSFFSAEIMLELLIYYSFISLTICIVSDEFWDIGFILAQ